MATAARPTGVGALAPSIPVAHALGALSGVALAVFAQHLLLDRQSTLDGLLAYGLGVGLFVRSVGTLFTPNESLLVAPARVPVDLPLPTRARWLLPATAITALITYHAFASNAFTRANVLVWAASLLMFAAAVLPAPRRAWRLRRGLSTAMREGISFRLRLETAALLVVIGLAVFLHFYRLGEVPAEPTSDHTENMLDLRDILNGQFPVFFARNTGREPLNFYLTAPVVKALGMSFLTLKLVTATVGVLIVIAIYFLGNELLGRGYGLAAAFLAAIAAWELGNARIGLRIPHGALATALTLLFLLRALRTGATREFLACGLVIGVGLYGYTSFRIVVPLILALGGLWLLWQPPPRRQSALHLARGLALSFGVALLLLVPLIHYMLDDPSMFWMRAASRLVGESRGTSFAIADVAASVLKALLMFNWRGDVGWTIVAPLLPVLDPVTGALFALGLAWLLHALVARRSLQAAVLLLSLVTLLAPTWGSFAFPNENPNANRSVTALPIVFLIAALPIGLLWRGGRSGLPGPTGAVVLATMVAGLLLAAGQANFQQYFYTYAENYRRSAPNTAEIAGAVRPFVVGIGTLQDVHTLLWPHWFDNRSLAFALGQPGWDQVVRDKRREIPAHAAAGGTRLYLVHPSDVEGRAILRASYPAGVERLHRSEVPGKDFLTFTVLDRG